MLLKEHYFTEDIAVMEETEVPGVYLEIDSFFFFFNFAGVFKNVHYMGRKIESMNAPARFPDSSQCSS